MMIVWVSQYDTLLSLNLFVRIGLSLTLLLLGVLICALGVLQFAQHKTTVNPLQPSKATSLVTTGVYKFTRNPMYLGMVTISLSVSIYFSTLLGLVFVALQYFYLTYFQIFPEERALVKLFGDEFTDYSTRVPRWLMLNFKKWR